MRWLRCSSRISLNLIMVKERFLRLEVIWKDSDMIELHISANNGSFSGKTEVYDTKESLLPFSDTLIGFPKLDKTLLYTSGQKGGYSFFQMKFYPIGLSGIVGVYIVIEENLYSNSNRVEEKASVSMELIVEPNAIDKFQKELATLARTEKGSAELLAIDKRLGNI